jgi:hypothetical protein
MEKRKRVTKKRIYNSQIDRDNIETKRKYDKNDIYKNVSPDRHVVIFIKANIPTYE